MSKTITAQRRNDLASPLTTDNTCWYIKRQDGQVFGFTDADIDIVYNGVTYKALTGYSPSTIETKGNESVDNAEVVSVLDDVGITEEDIQKGLWDFAEVEIFSIDRNAPENGIVVLRWGWLGETETQGNRFKAEVRGIIQALKQKISPVYQPLCRANLGDSRCGVNLANFTDSGTVDSYDGSSLTVTDSSNGQPAGYYTAGVLTWTSGLNQGFEQEVRDHRAGGEIVLAMPPVFDVAAGDTFDVHAGCQKRFIADCKDKFNNVKNFRGEPHLPGADAVLDYPDAH